MALDKVPLLAIAYICYYIAVTPPNPPASRKEISKYPRIDILSKEGIMPRWYIVKVALFLVMFCEIAVLFSTRFSSTILSRTTLDILVESSSTGVHYPSITPAFLAGFFLMLFGAYIRVSSYRALGSLFTFEVSIRDQHKLITGYPYSIVRHPGYTGSTITFAGAFLCLFGPGSWIVECGWLEVLVGKVFVVFMVVLHGYVLYVLLSRMANEDKMMRKEFGRQWDEWAKRVPYRLVPGVL